MIASGSSETPYLGVLQTGDRPGSNTTCRCEVGKALRIVEAEPHAAEGVRMRESAALAVLEQWTPSEMSMWSQSRKGASRSCRKTAVAQTVTGMARRAIPVSSLSA
jgi:hypothetical protein